MPIMTSKYPGRCQCGERFAVGTPIDYASKAVRACPSCRPELGEGAAPAAGGAPAPAAQAPRVVPTFDAAARDALLARLDPDQRKVAAWTPVDGNLRVVAAAGSGKTTTVTALVSNLIPSHVTPARLIVTTFTRKAADELIARLGRVVPADAMRALRVGTFHSLALAALRQVDGQRWALARCADAGRRVRARDVLGSDLLWANALGMGPIRTLGEPGIDVPEDSRRDYTQAVEVIRSRNIRFGSQAAADACAQHGNLPGLYTAWRLYDAQKRAAGSYDFGDLLDGYLDSLQGRDHGNVVIVDEAQDNDVRQAMLARALAGQSGRVLLVGDVRQSIYEWRGGAPELFKAADVDIGARTLYLPRNYRSGASIVALGNRVADGRTWSIGPAAQVGNPERQGAGSVTVRGFGEPADTADAVADEIAAAVRDGARPSDFAVLCRTRAQQGGYEAALLASNVPVAIVGGSSYFGSKGWQDFAATLAVVSNIADEYQLSRCVQREQHVGFFAARDVVNAYRVSRDSAVAIMNGAQAVRTDRTRSALFALARWVTEMRGIADFATVCDRIAERLCAQAAERSDGDDDVRAAYEAAAVLAGRKANAEEVLTFAAQCEGAAVDADDAAAAAGRVTISTLHKAKGREWPVVYVDATAGVFPHARCEGDERREQEEARLFYVGVTRAERTLNLTYATVDGRGRAAGPSEFLSYVETPEPPPAKEPAPLEIAAPPAPVAAEPVSAPSVGPTAAELRAALAAHVPVADRLTRSAAAPVAGQRFVPVSMADFDALLSTHGFATDETSERRTGQRVLAATLAGGARVLVYTSIPAGQEIARGLGEDSIKVTLLSAEGRPLMRRQPYAARTVNWRRTLLSRIDTALSTLA